MKRIAMISYHTCPLASQEGKESGGMNVYVYELARALALQGYSIDVFTRSQDKNNIPIVEVMKGFRVIHTVAGPQQPISKKELQPFIPDFTAEIRKFYDTERSYPDVIHAHYYLSGLIAVLLKQQMNPTLPIVLSFHTLSLMKNLVARDTTEKEEMSRVTAEIELCTTVEHIIATSDSDKKYLEYLYDAKGDRITVIPPGVNPLVFHPVKQSEAKRHLNLPEGQQMILFVGRIEPLKGIDMLMYAMKIIVKRNPELRVCLCIAGGDISQPQMSWSKTLQALNDIRHMLHLTTTVNFVGQKTQEELLYFYTAASMVVMPSHYESFGMAALEAMSCGIPVITTNAAGISSLIDEKHSQLITSVNNPLLLASQIEFLLKSPDKREELGREVRENVSDLSWESVARRVADVYTSVSL